MPFDPVQSALRFRPPPAARVRAFTAPARRWFSPVVVGEADVGVDRPALFVGNHTLYGVLDIPLIAEHLYSAQGVFVRGLGDHMHFRVPGWRRVLQHIGAVDGTPETCAALMRAGQSIMVFPGGAREVCRRRDELYALVWKQRTGFARLALEHGYDIVPFASLGPDECFDIVLDADDISGNATAAQAMARLGLDGLTRGGDVIPPLGIGVGPTFLPRPQRFYFGFGARIAVAAQAPTEQARWALREEVATAIEGQLDALLAYRETDRATWSPLRRMLAPVRVRTRG